MATPNFHIVNTPYYFVFYSDNAEDYIDLQDNLISELKSQKQFDFNEDDKKKNDNKNYPIYPLGTITKGDCMFNVFIRYGYYTGCTLDYEETTEVNNEQYLIDSDDISEYLQALFDRYSEKYIRTALFSNGEAIYEKYIDNEDDKKRNE